MTDYYYDVYVYSGRETNQVYGTLGERVVTKLCKTVPDHNVIFSFDRLFTSVKLLEDLRFPAIDT